MKDGPSDASVQTYDSAEQVVHGEASKMPQVDSDDIPVSPAATEPFFQQLLKRMSPAECLSPATHAVQACSAVTLKSCVSSDREELEWQLTDLLKDIRGGHKPRTAALHRLYRLTDREHVHNRVPAVCTTSFATIQALVTCLKPTVAATDRRQAILIINNLCIPTENKAAILFGEPCDTLLTALLELIRNRQAESYLATVALLNLSYLQDDHAKTMLYNYVPARDNGEAATKYTYQLPGDNPYSTIRTLESLLREYVPYANQKINSVEQQCCRWSMNVVRNLVSVPDNALAVGTKTAIPALAAQCLSGADSTNLKKWTRDSLEDACLMLLVRVCKIDKCLNVLKKNQTATDQLVAVCEELEDAQGIHQTRAVALLERFDEETSCRSVGFSV